MKSKLMTHIVAGFPSFKASRDIALMMVKNNVDFLEIQIPFSDPIADGKTIMQANQKALDKGITPKDCFKLAQEVIQTSNIPVLFMTYFNIIYNYGLEKFCKDCKKIGIFGLIVPDIPINEEKNEEYIKTCKKYGLHPIQVISPLTNEKRLKQLSKVISGFVYCVSSYGTTGEQTELNPKLKNYISKVKKYIKLPLAVGFGISNKKQVDAVCNVADVAVIGSKILNLYKDSKGDKLKSVENFLKSLN